MIPVIVYPIPFDNWETFAPFVKRFADTFKEFPPGVEDYEVWATCQWGRPSPEIRSWFYGIKTVFFPYDAHGCDIGSAQAVARTFRNGSNPFVLAMTSRCYFHRKDWLLRYVQARQKHGPGLYGTFASWESAVPHICTRAYGMDAADWNEYPHEVLTRSHGQKFEVGEWCVSQWMEHRFRPLVQVLWDNEQGISDWRKMGGAFRQDRQQCCLVWDKHTDLYSEADPEEKARLEAMCDMPSFSQCGEDRWIVENLHIPQIGKFVEVGAFDGQQSSNTLLFERMGWSGLCIEADPELAEQCQANRKATTLSCAVTPHPGIAVFHVNPDDRGLSGLTRPGKPIEVAARRLDQILKAASLGPVDVLSIDTEGTELDVWDSLGDIRPAIVIIEHQTCDLPSQESAITKRLARDGYTKVHRTQYNLIFRRLDPGEH